MYNASQVAGTRFYLSNTKLVFSDPFSTSGGVWIQTNANTFASGSWHHVVVTYNRSNTANDPIIYIDASVQALTEFTTPVGTAMDETGGEFQIGNTKNSAGVYVAAFDGKIFDPRIYNRVLSAAEVTTLYNGGTPDHTLVTDGLVFQGLATYADRPLAAGTVLTSTDRLVENIIRAVGVPNGSPTIRANP